MIPLLGFCMNVYSVVQTCPTLCSPMDCSPPGSFVHGITQARILEWITISSSRGSSQPGDWTCLSTFRASVYSLPVCHLEAPPWVLNASKNGQWLPSIHSTIGKWVSWSCKGTLESEPWVHSPAWNVTYRVIRDKLANLLSGSSSIWWF